MQEQASELIADAYYLSGIVGREYSTPTNTQTTDGLRWLNQLLSQKSINSTLINYYTHYEVPISQGVDIYTIPNLTWITAVTFNLGTVRFSMVCDSVNNYWGLDRVDDVQSLPFHYYAERQEESMIIYLYFVPDQSLELKITGKFALTQITDVNTTLEYDGFYLKLLKYELCSDICDEFNIEMPNKPMQTLINLRRSLRDLTGIDLTLKTKSLFPSYPSYDQATATIARGWGR